MSRRHRRISARLDAEIAKKVRREVNTFLASQAGHMGPPGPRHVLTDFPLIDGLAVERLIDHLGEFVGQNGSAAESIDEFPSRRHVPPIVRQSIGVVNDDKHDDPKYHRRHNSSMSDANTKNPYAVACGERLRRARIALGYTKLRRFAELTGTHEDSLSAWELGKNHVPTSYVQQLKELFGISHDWVYGNDASCMRQDLSVKILNTVLEED